MVGGSGGASVLHLSRQHVTSTSTSTITLIIIIIIIIVIIRIKVKMARATLCVWSNGLDHWRDDLVRDNGGCKHGRRGL